MYGLPVDTDLSFLLGCELIQVCIGQYQAQLHFQQRTQIDFTCPFSLTTSAGVEWGAADQPPTSARLVALLGQTIEHIHIPGDGRLALSFSGGVVLTLTDPDPRYESYEVHGPTGQTIIV